MREPLNWGKKKRIAGNLDHFLKKLKKMDYFPICIEVAKTANPHVKESVQGSVPTIEFISN